MEGVKPYGYLATERAVIDRMRQLRRKPAKGRRPSLATVASHLNLATVASHLIRKGTGTELAVDGQLKWSITSSIGPSFSQQLLPLSANRVVYLEP